MEQETERLIMLKNIGRRDIMISTDKGFISVRPGGVFEYSKPENMKTAHIDIHISQHRAPDDDDDNQ